MKDKTMFEFGYRCPKCGELLGWDQSIRKYRCPNCPSAIYTFEPDLEKGTLTIREWKESPGIHWTNIPSFNSTFYYEAESN